MGSTVPTESGVAQQVKQTMVGFDDGKRIAQLVESPNEQGGEGKGKSKPVFSR